MNVFREKELREESSQKYKGGGMSTNAWVQHAVKITDWVDIP